MPHGDRAGARTAPLPRVVRALLRLLSGLTVAAVAALGAVPPAAAHDGTSVVRLAVDGAGGSTTVHAFVVYRGDGQPVVEEYLLAEVISGGRTRSFQVRPRPGVAGEYVSAAHLPDGHWQLVVSATAATSGSASGEFDVVAGKPTRAVLSASFTPTGTSSTASGGSSAMPWLTMGALVLVTMVGLVALSGRRAKDGTADPRSPATGAAPPATAGSPGTSR